MRSLFLILLLLRCITFSFAEGKEDKKYVLSSTVSLGKKHRTSDTIFGIQHTFPCKIEALSLDPENGDILLLSYNGKVRTYEAIGYLALYNTSTKSFSWQRKIKAYNLATTKDHILLSGDKGTYCYEKSSSKMLWKKSYTWLQPLGRDTRLGVTTDGKVIDLQTGNTVWNRKLRGKYYVEDVLNLDDSTLLVAQGGLHLVNKTTGEGVSFNDNSEDKGRGGSTALSFLTAMTFITGSGMTATAAASEALVPRQGMCSRIMVENDRAYYATRERLMCIDLKARKLVWQSELDAEETGSSVIRADKENVYLLNTGIGYNIYGRPLHHGEPYLATFNKIAGRRTHIEKPNFDLILEKKIYQGNWTVILNSNEISFDLREKDKTDLTLTSKSIQMPGGHHWMLARANGMFRAIQVNDKLIIRKNEQDVAEFKAISAGWFENDNLYLVSGNKLQIVALDQF